MKHMRLKNLAYLTLVVILSSITGASFASEPGGYKVVDGMAIYFAVLPAEMIRNYSKELPEAAMHGGVPSGKHIHHVMAAVFEANSFDRITDAEVKATVSEIGLAGETKILEPFTIAEALTYGNYFEMPNQEIYLVKITVQRPGYQKNVEASFEYKHH